MPLPRTIVLVCLASAICGGAALVSRREPQSRAAPTVYAASAPAGSAWQNQPTRSRRLTGIDPELFGAPNRAPVAPGPHTRPARSSPPAPADPLAGWRYSAFATVDGAGIALLENHPTGASRFVRVGDDLQGYRVESIDRRELRAAKGGDSRRLALSDRFDLVPLDRSAGYLGGGSYQHAADLGNSLNNYVSFSLTRMGRLTALSASGEDHDKLLNDVYDGRISQQEFDRRSGPQTVVLTLSAGDATIKLSGALSADAAKTAEDAVITLADTNGQPER